MKDARLAVVPGVPNANVTELPVILAAASPRIELSDAAPQSGEVPVRDMVPVNAPLLLLVTVKNPVSGLAQMVPAVLQYVVSLFSRYWVVIANENPEPEIVAVPVPCPVSKTSFGSQPVHDPPCNT